MSDKLVVGYWKIRGLVQPIRTMMAYANEDYIMKEYRKSVDESGKMLDLDGWFDVKHSMGFQYPNLPYLIDGELKLTESNAIFGYLGEKFGLHGSTAGERAQVVMHSEVVMAFRNAYVKLCYYDQKNFEANKSKYFNEELPNSKNAHFYLGEFEKVLKKNKWLLGDKLTFPDFHLYEMLFAHCELYGYELLDKYPSLQSFRSRFYALPRISAIEEKTKDLNINNITAKYYGNK